ncbi:hypothetical protein [Roseibacillus persicicus]|uniref:Uncharacterized protein n=1 Tax=Roseibacillus persicicus TaxID=454148 RepID=A0A918U0I4_9BACT|nr:hypothetical protein [Roseibacillus persicicus]MDQ8192292.1 hypothetical protein [Roseibacillus persicicus]GHC67521.1 hypothetical protein GCM10007100_39510 [Roseibacillus persicicus]
MELDYGREVELGASQIVNGWNVRETWKKLIAWYRLENYQNGKWFQVASFDSV